MYPILSIIVPVFNTEQYLTKCLDSIINQVFQDFELIIIDDGSTDGSGLVCDIYASMDSRIKVVHKKNGGQSSARNIGINMAQGTYIGFVDSDDWIHESMYYVLINHALKYKKDIVACNFNLMNKYGNHTLYSKNSIDKEYSKDEAMREIYTNKILSFSPCNKIYKLALFDEIMFREGVILEDMDIAYRLIHISNGVSYIKEAYYFYRYNERSTLRSEFKLNRIDEYNIREDMYLFYKEHYPNIAKLVYIDFCKNRSRLFANIKDSNLADIEKYSYIIKYDKSIFKDILKQEDFSLKNRVILLLLMNFPKLEVDIKRIWIKSRTFFYAIKMYFLKEY